MSAPIDPVVPAADARLIALRAWLATRAARHSIDVDSLVPASADASFRRYFRVAPAYGTAIAMDAPPEREDSAAFVRVARLMADAGLHVPRVLEQDLGAGFLVADRPRHARPTCRCSTRRSDRCRGR